MSPKPGVLQNPLVPQGNHWLHSDRLVFPIAAESPSSPGEDLAWSPGCDRHVAVQSRLDIMEEVRRAREEEIVKLRGHLPGWKL